MASSVQKHSLVERGVKSKRKGEKRAAISSSCGGPPSAASWLFGGNRQPCLDFTGGYEFILDNSVSVLCAQPNIPWHHQLSLDARVGCRAETAFRQHVRCVVARTLLGSKRCASPWRSSRFYRWGLVKQQDVTILWSAFQTQQRCEESWVCRPRTFTSRLRLPIQIDMTFQRALRRLPSTLYSLTSNDARCRNRSICKRSF